MVDETAANNRLTLRDHRTVTGVRGRRRRPLDATPIEPGAVVPSEGERRSAGPDRREIGRRPPALGVTRAARHTRELPLRHSINSAMDRRCLIVRQRPSHILGRRRSGEMPLETLSRLRAPDHLPGVQRADRLLRAAARAVARPADLLSCLPDRDRGRVSPKRGRGLSPVVTGPPPSQVAEGTGGQGDAGELDGLSAPRAMLHDGARAVLVHPLQV